MASDLWSRLTPQPPLSSLAFMAYGMLMALFAESGGVSASETESVMLNDIRFALRSLRRTPVFSIAAVSVLSLGLAAAAATWCVAYGVLFRPLPFPDSDRIIRVYEQNLSQQITRYSVSPGTFVDWRDRSQSFNSIAVFSTKDVVVIADGRPSVVRMAFASPAFTDVLSIRPAQGRVLTPEGNRTPQPREDEVLISDRFWRSQLGMRSDAVGMAVILENRYPLTIVGIMPAGSEFPDDVDLWRREPLQAPIVGPLRALRNYGVIARLRDGVEMQTAAAELTNISSGLSQQYPVENGGWSAYSEPLQTSITGDVRTAILLITAAVGLLLLTALSNVANLLLNRAIARYREFQVRAALGARAVDLLRHWAAEAVTLTAMASVVSLLLTSMVLDVVTSLAPRNFPRIHQIALGRETVLVSTVLALLGVAVLAGLPLVRVKLTSLGGLRDGRSGTRNSRSHAFLVGAQACLTVILLISTFLLIRSFGELRSSSTGFNAGGVVFAQMRLPAGRFPQTKRPWALIRDHFEDLVHRVADQPGVVAAGAVSTLPLAERAVNGSVWSVDAPKDAGKRMPSGRYMWKADINIVTPGYFDALRVPLLAGRHLSPGDRFSAEQLTQQSTMPAIGAVVINEAFARRYFGKSDPIGRSLVIFDVENFAASWAVVGVVGDITQQSVESQPGPAVYVPLGEAIYGFRLSIVARTSGSVRQLAAALSRQMREFDDQLVVPNVGPLGDVISESRETPRFYMTFVSAFSLMAIVLAAIGTYGTVSQIVAERTPELGIRTSLGAPRTRILWFVLRKGLWPVTVGICCAIPLLPIVAKGMHGMLFKIAPYDLVSIFGAMLVLLAAAFVACYIPARRACRLDPTLVLRLG